MTRPVLLAVAAALLAAAALTILLARAPRPQPHVPGETSPHVRIA